MGNWVAGVVTGAFAGRSGATGEIFIPGVVMGIYIFVNNPRKRIHWD